MKNYIFIGNQQSTEIIELEQIPNDDGYITFGKYNVRDKLVPKPYSQMKRMGLFESLETAENNRNSPCGVHRLVMCLYSNCIGHKVHHIDKDRQANNICNLINMIKKKHDAVHRLSDKDGQEESFIVQNKLKKKLFRKPKSTLAQNEELIREIFRLRAK